MMIKKYWKTIVASVIVTLLPLFVGLALWNQLPDLVPSHFNAQGETDGWMQKAQFIFLFPAILLGTQLFVILCIVFDNSNKKMSDKVARLVFWIIPVTSILMESISYASAMGINVPVVTIVFIFSGVLFIILGNVMGKARYSFTVGLRLPTTLNDEQNWFHTHRVFGWTMVIAGLVLVATSFLQSWGIYITATALAVIVPMTYSFVYAARHPAAAVNQDAKSED